MRKGLKRSIEKWENIIRGECRDDKSDNCGLCIASGRVCGNCIIPEVSGSSGCSGTPWEAWYFHQRSMHLHIDHLVIRCEVCQRLAEEELLFLKSLWEV